MDLTSFGVEVEDNKPKEIVDKNLKINMDKIQTDYLIKDVERYLPWFLKYKVEKIEDLIITKEIKKILDFLKTDKNKHNKGILLFGPAGSGKTTTLNLIGEHFNYELFELNASDARNKKSILESVGDVIKQKSLFGQEKLILIDEVDGVSGTNDRGGVAELIKLIKNSNYPVTFTANDIDSPKIKALKKKCILVDFVNNSQELLVGIAKRIFKNENIEYDESELFEFVDARNTSDIRGFINDIQASVFESKFCGDNSEMEVRDYKKKIETLLDKIYYSYPEDSLFSSFNTDINLDDLFLYLEENTPSIYEKKELIVGFSQISKADVFKGRIMKWQYWRFLVYVNFYLTFGVSTAKKMPKKVKSYKRNGRILKKWIYGNKVNTLRLRTKIEKKKDLPLRFIEKLAKHYGTSAKRCRSSDIFYFALQYKNDREFQQSMDNLLDIDSSTKQCLLGL